jgi:hypothetical protein
MLKGNSWNFRDASGLCNRCRDEQGVGSPGRIRSRGGLRGLIGASPQQKAI